MDMSATPLPYDPSQEQVPDDEAETELALSDTLKSIYETTYKNSGHAIRSVHAKSHGIVRGTLTVAEGLSPILAQGLFSRAGSYPMVMRFSTPPGDIIDDSIGLPRGLALKLLGVEGERLPGSEDDTTQDFVLVNGPAFAAPTPAKFAGNLKLLAKTTDAPQVFKKIISTALRGMEATLEAFGGESAAMKTMGGAPQLHPLGETFYSQTAFLFGRHVAKFAVRPIAPALTALTGTKVAIGGRPDALREEMVQFFEQNGGDWELCVQLRTDAAAMPIEDPSVPWSEESSPYLPVAHLRVEAQQAWQEAASVRLEDALSFSPWHGLAAHRPLGGINRVRRVTYKKSAAFRRAHNGCPMHEPRDLESLKA